MYTSIVQDIERTRLQQEDLFWFRKYFSERAELETFRT